MIGTPLASDYRSDPLLAGDMGQLARSGRAIQDGGGAALARNMRLYQPHYRTRLVQLSIAAAPARRTR